MQLLTRAGWRKAPFERGAAVPFARRAPLATCVDSGNGQVFAVISICFEPPASGKFAGRRIWTASAAVRCLLVAALRAVNPSVGPPADGFFLVYAMVSRWTGKGVLPRSFAMQVMRPGAGGTNAMMPRAANSRSIVGQQEALSLLSRYVRRALTRPITEAALSDRAGPAGWV